MSETFQVGLSASELLQRVRLNLCEDQDRLPFTKGSSAFQGSINGDVLSFRLAGRPFLAPNLSARFDDSGPNALVTFRSHFAYWDWGLWVFVGVAGILTLPLLHNGLVSNPAVPLAREIENAMLVHDMKFILFTWIALSILFVLAGIQHFSRCRKEFLGLIQRVAIGPDGQFLPPRSAQLATVQTTIQGHQITIRSQLPLPEVRKNLQRCFDLDSGFFRHPFQGGLTGMGLVFYDPSILSGKNSVPHQFEGSLNECAEGVGTEIRCLLQAPALKTTFPWAGLGIGLLVTPMLMLPHKTSPGLAPGWALFTGLAVGISTFALTRTMARAKLKELEVQAHRVLVHCAANAPPNASA